MKEKAIGFIILLLSAFVEALALSVLIPLYGTWQIQRYVINKWDQLFAGIFLALIGIGVMLIAVTLLAKGKNRPG